MTRRRRSSTQQDQEDISRKQFEAFIVPFGWKPNDIKPDLGEDFFIQIYDQGNSTGLSLYVQLKSVKNIDDHRLKSGDISYPFDAVDLEHWENHTPPVYLIVWDVHQNKGWWMSVGEAISYLKRNNPNWRKKNNVSIQIPSDKILDVVGLKRIRRDLADLYFPIIAKDKTIDIHARFQFPPTPEGKQKLAEFERHISAGDIVELDGRYIQKFELPDFWKRLYGEIDIPSMHLRLGPTKNPVMQPAQIEFFSPEVGTERIPYVELRSVKQGQDEITLSNDAQNIPIRIRIILNSKEKKYIHTYTLSYANIDGYTTRRHLRIQQILEKGGHLEITLLKTGHIDHLPIRPGNAAPIDPKMLAFVEKVCAIQDATGININLPDDGSYTSKDEAAAQELVSIIETGKYAETGKTASIELRKPAIVMLTEIHEKKQQPLRFRFISDNSFVDLLTEQIEMGPMIQYITGQWEMPIKDVRAWLESATEEDHLKVKLIDVEMVEEFDNWLPDKDISEENTSRWIKRLIEIEDDIHYQEYASEDEPEFGYYQGSLPILISAPHGAAHTRNGRQKDEDEFTASLAFLLGEETGSHAFYARRKSITDPNVDPAAPYKEGLAKIIRENGIRFVLDLHGVRGDRTYGIELGTADNQSCSKEEKDLIVSTLNEFGFVNDHTERFQKLWIDKVNKGAGVNGETIIRFVSKNDDLNISAAQFELNANLRIPQRKSDATQAGTPFEGDPTMIARTIQAFKKLVFRLALHINDKDKSN